MKNDTPTNELVTDTTAMVLRLEKRKLGQAAKSLFESAKSGDTHIYIPRKWWVSLGSTHPTQERFWLNLMVLSR